MDFQPLFKKAKEKGIEAIQVHVEKLEEIEFDVFKGELDKHKIADTARLTIKGIYEGKMGKMTTESLSMQDTDEWVDAIIDSAKVVESEDEVFIYEGDDKYPEIEGLGEAKLAQVSVEDKKDLTFKLERLVREKDERVSISEASYGEAKRTVILKNSKGLDLERTVHSGIIVAQVVVREGDDTRSAFEYIQSDDTGDFDLEALADKAVRRGVSLLGARAVASGKYDILLENRASANLLQAYVNMFNAEHVQKGLSKLHGAIGKDVGGENITIIDDPFREKSTKSATFDDEGVATAKKTIVDGGVLKTYLYDLKTAKKDDTKSTANSFGDTIQPTNLYIAPGKARADTAIEKLDKGLYITDLQGLHSGTNFVSGDFSLQASGYLVENGKIVRPVALITVSGNYLDMLKNVAEVFDDLRFNFSYIGSPTLRIDGMQISGN